MYKIVDIELLLKSLRELEHIHFMLQVRSRVTQRWSELIQKIIIDKRRLYGVKSDKEFIRKILQDDKSEIDMQKESSTIEVIQGIRCLTYNNEADSPKLIQLGEVIVRSKAKALMAAIYQTCEVIEEFKTAKDLMKQTLKDIEDGMIRQFVRESFGHKLIE